MPLSLFIGAGGPKESYYERNRITIFNNNVKEWIVLTINEKLTEDGFLNKRIDLHYNKALYK